MRNKKDSLLQNLSENGEKFLISQIVENAGILPLNSILDITIKITFTSGRKNCLIAYETNIINSKKITILIFKYWKKFK